MVDREAGLPDPDDGWPRPVEVKSRACGDRGPYEGEVAQVAAYCLVVEDVFGGPVPHGILQFSDRDVLVPFTAKRREKVLAVLAEMRALDERLKRIGTR